MYVCVGWMAWQWVRHSMWCSVCVLCGCGVVRGVWGVWGVFTAPAPHPAHYTQLGHRMAMPQPVWWLWSWLPCLQGSDGRGVQGLPEEEDQGSSFGSDPRQPEAWRGLFAGTLSRAPSITSAPTPASLRSAASPPGSVTRTLERPSLLSQANRTPHGCPLHSGSWCGVLGHEQKENSCRQAQPWMWMLTAVIQPCYWFISHMQVVSLPARPCAWKLHFLEGSTVSAHGH